MPEKDVSRRVVEAALAKIGRVRAAMHQRLPYGPRQVAMKPGEARRWLEQMAQPGQNALREQMGLDEWEKLMEKLYGNNR